MKGLRYLALLFGVSNADSQSQTEILPNSCIGLDDGEHWLKLMDGDDYPAVKVKCSNEYTILDWDYDMNIESYLLGFMKFHHSIGGPSNDYIVNWEGFYIPDDGNTEYIISPDCNVCESDHKRQIFDTKTGYMMTGTLFGCFWNLKGEHNFDMDFETYQCYYTSGILNAIGEEIRNPLDDDSEIDDWDNSGVCAVSVRAANREVSKDVTHDFCTGDIGETVSQDISTYHLKPSIGLNGEYCLCTKPSATQYFEVDSSTLIDPSIKRAETKAMEEVEVGSMDDEYELYQKDFERGTYRIVKPGTYNIMEDITFDFNADHSDPLSGDAWWPQKDQSETYEGAQEFHGPYFVGFFAGITIESNDVILDLKGFTLKMSDSFYYQQRWFTTIALQTQYFLPGQGIGMFGANPKFASNIIIQNGVLGLSSHHNIHGHFNSDVTLQNLKVRDFETHGIQFNGFDNVVLTNVEVGPSSSQVWFRGEYGHSRTLLPRFRKVAEEYPDTEILFANRDEPTTMTEIVEELEKQTKMAYNYVVHGTEYSEDDESWQSAQELFLNPTGLPNGAAMYGIFLNTYGASVLTYNLYTSFYSSKATLQDVKIHGLKHSMLEYVRIQQKHNGNIFMNPLHAPYDVRQLIADESFSDLDNAEYKGSILTDAYFALDYLSDNWNYLQAQLLLKDEMLEWAFGNKKLENFVIGCNIDVMIHSGKGINGLRIDGVDYVTVNGLEIYDSVDVTPFGSTTCGEYSIYDGSVNNHLGGGHFRQTSPMQIGFSGNMMQGFNINAAKNIVIQNTYIHDISSDYGEAYGISIWPANDITFDGITIIENIKAGTAFSSKDSGLDYESRPNRAPEACGVRLYKQATHGNSVYTTEITMTDNAKIHSKCIEGHTSCLSQGMWTMRGFYDDCDTDTAVEDNNDEEESVPSKLKFKYDKLSFSDPENNNQVLTDENINNSEHTRGLFASMTTSQRIAIVIITGIMIFGFIFLAYRHCKTIPTNKLLKQHNNVKYTSVSTGSYGSM